MLDDKYNPWLIEVNYSPALSIGGMMDQSIKEVPHSSLCPIDSLHPHIDWLHSLSSTTLSASSISMQMCSTSSLRTVCRASIPRTPRSEISSKYSPSTRPPKTQLQISLQTRSPRYVAKNRNNNRTRDWLLRRRTWRVWWQRWVRCIRRGRNETL